MTGAPIWENAVIGWLVIRVKSQPGCFIMVKPLTVDWQGILNDKDLDLSDEDEVVGVIPAVPGTYEVWGQTEDGRLEPLGYELPGVLHPDWCKELEKMRRRKQ